MAEPTLTRKQLRVLIPAVYAWLYRHDRAWLNTQHPVAVKHAPAKPRHDWVAIDAYIAGALRKEASRITATVPPILVTRAALERTLGQAGWLEKRLAKLPLCASALHNLVETDEDFQRRRILWADAELHRQQLPVEVWRLRRLAGLPAHCAPSVEMALNAAKKRAS